MSQSLLPAESAEDCQQELNEWITAVEQLVQDVESWCQNRAWATRREAKVITEDRLGQYTVPRLLIHSTGGRLLLDPVARHVHGAMGLVDLYVLPSYDSMMLARTAEGWQLHSNGPDENPKLWSEQVFVETASQLLAAG